MRPNGRLVSILETIIQPIVDPLTRNGSELREVPDKHSGHDTNPRTPKIHLRSESSAILSTRHRAILIGWGEIV